MRTISTSLGRTIACALFLLLLVTSLPATAQRSWRISNFQTNIAVMDNGTMLVTEHISLVFIGTWHGIHRTLPIEYPGPHGSNYTLFLKVRSVTDSGGSALKYDTSVKGAYRDLKIYIPGAEDTSKQVNIQYEVLNGIRFFDSYDELYWNVTGNDWPVPIDHSQAFVLFPDKASGQLRAQAFTGFYGSHAKESTAEVNGNQVSFETTNPLSMREGLTIDVYIPKGILDEPSAFTKAGWFIRSNSIILLPLFAFAVMLTMWWYKGRDPQSGLSVAPMYEPPKDMSPAETGSLIDDSVDPRDVTSTIVDLAVRGYIHIEEKAEKILFFKNTDYIFRLLKPRNEWKDLRDHEEAMLSNMFSSNDLIHLSDLKNRFYLALPGVKKSILSELKQKGMYSVDPDSANAYRVLAVLIIAAPFVLLQVTGQAQFFLAPGIAIASIILAIIIVFLIGRLMTAKTLRGVRTVVYIQGFREFMDRVEGDRLRTMPPDTFEKFLPYAMALGVEKHWAHAFQGIIQNPPTWYTGTYPGGYFNPIFFTSSMNSLTSSTYEAFTAAPRASSSGSGWGGGGGFSGGGFSGGGFGGGGGSAF
ncbi:MAG: DUF2207 domain-containing protein [Acidobacteriaceae bacterium]